MNDPSDHNVARHLHLAAQEQPEAWATQSPTSIAPDGTVSHRHSNFRQLDQETDAAARIFHAEGINQGTRVLLALKPGHDLIVGMFGLLKLGAIPIAIDPGMGWKSFLNCVHRSNPEAMVGTRTAIWLSRLPFVAFQTLKVRIKVGTTRWHELIRQCLSSTPRPPTALQANDLAAILFTSGSTGKPKGVCYTHGMFNAQIELIRKTFGIQPGEVDMPMLPLFALFNPALRMTTVTPWLNPSRPASAHPAPIVSALLTEKVTNSFGSPAIWSLISHYCVQKNIQLPNLRRLLIAGAPVPDELLERLQAIAPQCQIHTPYGATECLPVSTIEAKARLNQTRDDSLQGHGTCVGRAVSGVTIKIIRETNGAITKLSEATLCDIDEIGEIIVTGPTVTHTYDHLPEATRLAKIYEGPTVWHRMGDLGKLDAVGRLWFLGRKAEKVVTAQGDLYTEAIEPVFRTHPSVARCALVGVGSAPAQQPYLVIELRPNAAETNHQSLLTSLHALQAKYPHTAVVKGFVFEPKIPVDVRHNAKIHRLKLSEKLTRSLGRKNWLTPPTPQ